MRGQHLLAVLCAGICAAAPLVARAAEPLHVLCGGAAAALIEQFAREFERAHGRPVVVTEGTAGQIRAKLAGGASADIVIVSAPVLGDLATAGNLVDGTRVDLGRTGIGVGIATGAVAPDLSTPDALKRALLAAPSIASTDPAAGASSGIYFASVLEKLGIADAVKPKETLLPGGFSCELVASGKAALCVQNISEIVPVHGVVVAAPFPAALQNYITYSGAVLKASTDPEAARAFLTEATSPANTARWAAAGFEPVPPAGR